MTWDRSRKEGSDYEVFISHASSDKEEIVRPLAQELSDRGISVWYDEFELELGDSISEAIDKGLATSEYGVVILSKNFFKTNWTQYELNSLISRQTSSDKIIIPIWYDISREEILEYSPVLADLKAVKIDEDNISYVADKIKQLVRNKETSHEPETDQDRDQSIPITEIQSVMRFEATRIPPHDLDEMEKFFMMFKETVLKVTEQHKPLYAEVELAQLVDIIGVSLGHSIDDFRDFSYKLSIDEKEAGRYLALMGLEEMFADEF